MTAETIPGFRDEQGMNLLIIPVIFYFLFLCAREVKHKLHTIYPLQGYAIGLHLSRIPHPRPPSGPWRRYSMTKKKSESPKAMKKTGSGPASATAAGKCGFPWRSCLPRWGLPRMSLPNTTAIRSNRLCVQLCTHAECTWP